ncbi:unnamed protein product [Phaedon cochleariae]|uniref:Major facilitator superfamily (MFS) profile domain-containing protein n=1 Tax=Phaedon cochleariae TaxID=80249 RepID=A0A9P0DKQ1_PHACE|nr:unnamed protein product [Phaedon cochleariae]
MVVDSTEHKSSLKQYFPQFCAATTGTLFAISDGMTYGWTAPYIPYLISNESHIVTTKSETEWLETCLLIGALCGLPLTIYSVDRFGRKKSLLFASITIFIAWVLIAFADRMLYLFIARFLSGMAGDMAFVAAPMYMAEMADQQIRGFLSGIIYIMVHIGSLVVYCFGPFTPFYVTPLIGSAVVITQLSVFTFMPETPYYLMYKNRREEARKALEYFKPYCDIDKELDEISTSLAKQKADKGRMQDLVLVKSNRRAIVIMTILNTGQHLLGYTVILMNLHIILESAGSIYMESSHAAILFAGIMLISAIFSSLQVDKYGRKVLLIISSVSSAMCLLAIAIYFHLKSTGIDVLPVSWIPIVSVMVYGAFFKIGVGMVPIIVTAEIFPSNMKAFGMTIADAMFIIGGIVGIQIYQRMAGPLGIHVPFYFFGCWGFFVAIFTHFFIPETKGKSLDEIQSLLKGEGKIVRDNNTAVVT